MSISTQPANLGNALNKTPMNNNLKKVSVSASPDLQSSSTTMSENENNDNNDNDNENENNNNENNENNNNEMTKAALSTTTTNMTNPMNKPMNKPMNNLTKTKKNMNNMSKLLTQKNTSTSTNNDDVTKSEDSYIDNSNSNKLNSEKKSELNRLCMNLLNHQIVLKLFHFQTELYGAHKASDAYISSYLEKMDKFLEVAQGIYGKITLKKYALSGSSHTDDNIVKHINGIIYYLRNKIDDILDGYTDLINIRDDLISDANQLKYLLTFK